MSGRYKPNMAHSQASLENNSAVFMKILIIGNGFIGQRCADAWPDATLSGKLIFSLKDAEDLLNEHQPEVVLNAAGIVGKPNVDWCETHQSETIFGNTILPLLIAEACQKKGVYLLHIGTGCIFYGQSPDSAGWREDDYANPVAVYTRSKYAADLVLATLSNLGIARIRMPIDYISSPANLINKLISYPKIVDVENSMTVIEDMLGVFRELLERKMPGIFHTTNPGAIRHREILDLYREIVDPYHNNEWISEEDLVKEGLAAKRRSNNILQSGNLKTLNFKMRPIKEALRATLIKYAELKKQGGQ